MSDNREDENARRQREQNAREKHEDAIRRKRAERAESLERKMRAEHDEKENNATRAERKERIQTMIHNIMQQQKTRRTSQHSPPNKTRKKNKTPQSMNFFNWKAFQRKQQYEPAGKWEKVSRNSNRIDWSDLVTDKCRKLLDNYNIHSRKDFNIWAQKGGHPDKGGNINIFKLVSDCTDKKYPRKKEKIQKLFIENRPLDPCGFK